MMVVVFQDDPHVRVGDHHPLNSCPVLGKRKVGLHVEPRPFKACAEVTGREHRLYRRSGRCHRDVTCWLVHYSFEASNLAFCRHLRFLETEVTIFVVIHVNCSIVWDKDSYLSITR